MSNTMVHTGRKQAIAGVLIGAVALGGCAADVLPAGALDTGVKLLAASWSCQAMRYLISRA